MDTRTRTRPQGASAEGIEADPGLYSVKVPTDPARLNTTTASFRVRLGAPVSPFIDSGPLTALAAGEDTQPILIIPAFPALVGAGAPVVGGLASDDAPPPRRKPRVTPITWTGGAAPALLDAVQQGGTGHTVLPRQQPADATQVMQRPFGFPDQADHAAADGREYAGAGYGAGAGGVGAEVREPGFRPRYGPGDDREFEPEYRSGGPREPGEAVRHAWYPGRRVDLGLVLLPLRLFLGGISIYAGFNKLCDPVYFDGGARGSMMHWLQSLHPWPLARPLLDMALTHPVGSGLGVAFVEIVVGVLCVFGLWQRFAAAVGMVLAVVLLVTVSWRAAPVYNAPEIIYLAAWSPLLLAGAPLFSLDGRLAIEAWRRLGGERAPIWALRRRVLRRGFVVATLVTGSTLLLGSMLGATVRSSQTVSTTTVLPGATALPTNYPNPMWPSSKPSAHGGATAAKKATPSPDASPNASHHAAAKHHSAGATGGGTSGSGAGSRSSGTGTGSTGTRSGTGSGSGGSGSSAPTHHHSGSPSSAPTGSNGVLGGLLG